MSGGRTDPRVSRSREAIVSAAIALFIEGGLGAVTHQAVAARAGVGRATVYRHWPCVLDLRLTALRAGEPPTDPMPPDLRAASDDESRAELAFFLRRFAARLDVVTGAVFAAIIDGAEHDDEMRRMRHLLLADIVDSLRPAVVAAVERGKLRPDVTVETFAMTALGPLFYQRFCVGAPLDDHTVDTVVEAALRAWAPHGLAGTPGNGGGRPGRRPDLTLT